MGYSYGYGAGEHKRNLAAMVIGGAVALSPNQVLLNAARSTRKLAICGASRFKQMAVGVSNQLRSLPTGNTSWAQMLDRRFDIEYWYDGTANQNSFNMNGGIFAADGDSWNQMWNRLPKIVASDFKLVILEMPSGGIQFEDYDIYAVQSGPLLTVNGYVNNMKLMVNYLINHGVGVIVSSLWERNIAVGGPWASGQAPRLLIPSIDATMKAWCDANGIPFLDIRPVMIDPGSSDNNPYTALARDGTHYSTLGGYATGKLFRDFIDDYFDPKPVSVVETGNKTTNPTMSGSGGSGLTGTLATGLTGTRLQASTATVTARIVTDGNGVRWQELEIDTSTMAAGTVEGVQLAIALNATVSGEWYQARCLCQVDAWDGWKGTPNMLADFGTRDIWIMPPVNSGGSVDNTIALNAAQGPTEAYEFELISGKVLADTTVTTASLRIYFTPGTGNGKVRFTQDQIYPVSDPTVFMYDESSVLTPSVTSSASLSIPENADYTHTLTSNMPGKWSISGTDAALIGTPDQHGRLVITAKDYEIPTDADANNVYTATITLTPYDLRRSAVTQTPNVTITDVDDGVTDLFNGVSGTDLADYAPSRWTRVGGAANAITIYTNGADAVNDFTKARTLYKFQRIGDTDEMQVSTRVSSVSAKMFRGLRVQDESNGLLFSESGGSVLVYRMNAGVLTTIATFTAYKSIAAGDKIGAQVLNNVLQVWQNDVPLVLASGSSAVTGALFFDGVKDTGLISYAFAGGGNRIWDYNAVVAGPHIDKVGLYALAMTPLTGSAGSNYAGALSNRKVGSTITVSVTKSAVAQTDWIADGDFIRCPSVTAGTYTVTVTENYSGAVNDGRQSAFTVVISP